MIQQKNIVEFSNSEISHSIKGKFREIHTRLSQQIKKINIKS
jgi:hypothetical protein